MLMLIGNDNTEWSLKENSFHSIVETYDMPSIDIFASRINRKVSPLCVMKARP